MTTTIKIQTPNDLLTIRENLIAEIKKSWSIISTNNVFPKGMMQKYDLNEVYKQIIKNEDKLNTIKIKLQLINLGFTDLSALPKKNAQSTIFALGQIKERITKLGLIPTKKEDGETVSLTRKFIESEIELLSKTQKKHEDFLAEYNSTISFAA